VEVKPDLRGHPVKLYGNEVYRTREVIFKRFEELGFTYHSSFASAREFLKWDQHKMKGILRLRPDELVKLSRYEQEKLGL